MKSNGQELDHIAGLIFFFSPGTGKVVILGLMDCIITVMFSAWPRHILMRLKIKIQMVSFKNYTMILYYNTKDVGSLTIRSDRLLDSASVHHGKFSRLLEDYTLEE